MESLGKDTRRLIQLAKGGHEPPATAKARLRERLDAKLGAAAIVATSGLVGKATFAQTALPVVTKSLFVSLVLVGAASVGYVAAPGHGDRVLPGGSPGASDPRHSALSRVERAGVKSSSTLTPAMSPIAQGLPVVPESSIARDTESTRAIRIEPVLAPGEIALARVPSVDPHLPVLDTISSSENLPRIKEQERRAVSRGTVSEWSPEPVQSAIASLPRAAVSEPGALHAQADIPMPRAEVQNQEAQEPTVAERTRDRLAEETRLIRQAHRSMLSGAFSQALEALDEHQRHYAMGVLQQEREATRIVVMCKLSRAQEAQAMWTRFASAWPSSPLMARVRSSCHWDAGL